MKGLLGKIGAVSLGMFFLLTPALIDAESVQTPLAPPPVAQPLIREGTLAVKLATALNLGTATSEAQAESWLGEKGISPRNGWIADYPVTPDITGELRQALGDAADAHKIALTRTEALNRLDSITVELAIAITPSDREDAAALAPEDGNMVPSADIYDYYSEEGPPVVTYYAPPDDYYYLYSWVPYPFWCGGFWFGGFFILNDFHRPVFVGRHHHKAFVSNHIVNSNNQVVIVKPATWTKSGSVSVIGSGGKKSGIPVTSSVMNTSTPSKAAAAVKSMTNSLQTVSKTSSGGEATTVNHQTGGNYYSGYKASSSSYGSYSRQTSGPTPVTGGFTHNSSMPSYHSSMAATPSFHGGGGFSAGGFSGGHARR